MFEIHHDKKGPVTVKNKGASSSLFNSFLFLSLGKAQIRKIVFTEPHCMPGAVLSAFYTLKYELIC